MPAALLIIDMINALDFDGAERLLPRALRATATIAKLKARARAAGMPVIYVNDNFGKWRSDFKALLQRCLHEDVLGKPIAERLKPDDEDYFVLKPMHSGFYCTALEILLQHLGVRKLVLTGMAANYCVLATAQDAYMRHYELVVPSDALAAEDALDEEYALRHMAEVLKADIRPAAELHLA